MLMPVRADNVLNYFAYSVEPMLSEELDIGIVDTGNNFTILVDVLPADELISVNIYANSVEFLSMNQVHSFNVTKAMVQGATLTAVFYNPDASGTVNISGWWGVNINMSELTTNNETTTTTTTIIINPKQAQLMLIITFALSSATAVVAVGLVYVKWFRREDLSFLLQVPDEDLLPPGWDERVE